MIAEDASLIPRGVQWALLGLIVALFCARNLPWHLDNFDQAKQAYTSFEMIETGHWLYQHTPDGDIATKPPLAGWISAALYAITRWWGGAWRIVSLVPALAILWMLWRSGNRLWPGAGGIVAACAFGLNSFAPRLATLVRTDMLLTFFIFGIGWIVFEKLRTDSTWRRRDQWLLFFLVLGSMMTKGPIAYAFLLPGLAVFVWRVRPARLPGGWWPWFVPMAIFLLWASAGALHSREFYEQVVMKEFLGRFTVGAHAVHHNQPVWFYAARLLGNFAPWSLLLIGLACVKDVRAAFRRRPELLWLACWALGGLIFMSLVPSKRADRIFPVIPPFAMLLSGMLAEYRGATPKFIAVVLALAVAGSGGFGIYGIVEDYREHQGALVDLGKRVRAEAAAHGWRYGIAGRRDEGILLYLRKLEFWSEGDAARKWRQGEIDLLVIEDRRYDDGDPDFQPARVIDRLPRLPGKGSGYVVITKP